MVYEETFDVMIIDCAVDFDSIETVHWPPSATAILGNDPSIHHDLIDETYTLMKQGGQKTIPLTTMVQNYPDDCGAYKLELSANSSQVQLSPDERSFLTVDTDII